MHRLVAQVDTGSAIIRTNGINGGIGGDSGSPTTSTTTPGLLPHRLYEEVLRQEGIRPKDTSEMLQVEEEEEWW